MRVLVTGHQGYIGCAMVPMLVARGHEVVGLDSGLFEGCDFGSDELLVPALRRDLREVTPDDLQGFDAVIHLAGISNDPLGDLNPGCTYGINHRASVDLARAAKDAGVPLAGLVSTADRRRALMMRRCQGDADGEAGFGHPA